MENKTIDLSYFISLDSENKLCVDCGAAMPEYVSINHGTLLCKTCINYHKTLGFNISYIRKINDEWDPYILNYIERGGNNRFLRFSYNYKVHEIPFNKRYYTRAIEYYRLLLRSEVLAEMPPESINLKNALEPCDLSIIYYPEFKDYHIYVGEYPSGDNGISVSGIGKSILYGSYKTLKNTGAYIFSYTKPVFKMFGNGLSYAYHCVAGNNYNTPKDDGKRSYDNEEVIKNEVLIPENFEEWSKTHGKNSKNDLYDNKKNNQFGFGDSHFVNLDLYQSNQNMVNNNNNFNNNKFNNNNNFNNNFNNNKFNNNNNFNNNNFNNNKFNNNNNFNNNNFNNNKFNNNNNFNNNNFNNNNFNNNKINSNNNFNNNNFNNNKINRNNNFNNNNFNNNKINNNNFNNNKNLNNNNLNHNNLNNNDTVNNNNNNQKEKLNELNENDNKMRYPIYNEENIKNSNQEPNKTPDITINEAIQIKENLNDSNQIITKEDSFEPTPDSKDN